MSGAPSGGLLDVEVPSGPAGGARSEQRRVRGSAAAEFAARPGSGAGSSRRASGCAAAAAAAFRRGARDRGGGRARRAHARRRGERDRAGRRGARVRRPRARRRHAARAPGADRPAAARAHARHLAAGRVDRRPRRDAHAARARTPAPPWSPRGLTSWRGAEPTCTRSPPTAAWRGRCGRRAGSRPRRGRRTATASPTGARAASASSRATAPRPACSPRRSPRPGRRGGPGAPHTLAWVDPSGRVVVQNVDTGGVVWRSAGGVGSARALSWSADGALLLIQAADGLRLADVRTRTVERVRAAERRPCGRCGVGARGASPRRRRAGARRAT